MPGAQAAPGQAAPAQTSKYANPITLYVARGAPDICGPGCSEWIVAEGRFGFGSASQFRALLARLGKQKLPVFFNSPGGLLGEGLAIGRLMREKGLASALGRTIPTDCGDDKDEKKAKACSELKMSGKKLEADLRVSEGRCNSTCVYAVLGGKTRAVAPGARLGVHAAQRVKVTLADKKVKEIDYSKLSPREQKENLKRIRDMLRTYVREMGIDLELVDVSDAVPNEDIRYLTRAQIVKFGIDRSTFSETPWKFIEGPSLAPAISKHFFEARGQEKSEFPASYIRLACSTNNIGKAAVFYSRGLISGETNLRQIKLLVGDDGLQVASTGVRQYDWIENERSFDVRFAVTDFSRLRVSGDVFEIVEASWASPAPYAHIVRLSAEGWGEALGRLREKCMNPGGISDRGTRG
jgi:hypothetical protein